MVAAMTWHETSRSRKVLNTPQVRLSTFDAAKKLLAVSEAALKEERALEEERQVARGCPRRQQQQQA